VVGDARTVETARKPSTGLKQVVKFGLRVTSEVETARKPSTGLKQGVLVVVEPFVGSRRLENPARD